MKENYYEREAHKLEREDNRGPLSDDPNNEDELERERQASIQKKYIRESSGKKKRRKKRKKTSAKNQYLLIAGVIVIVAILFCLALLFIVENEDIDVYSPSDITYVEPNNDIAPA